MTASTAWLLILIAGVLEIVWAVLLKQTLGFTRFWPSIASFSAMAASFWLLSLGVKSLPVGTAYAVWTGIGAAGTALCGMLFYHEPATLARILCIVFILIGIFGLKFFNF